MVRWLWRAGDWDAWNGGVSSHHPILSNTATALSITHSLQSPTPYCSSLDSPALQSFKVKASACSFHLCSIPSLQQTPQSTQSLISLFVHFTPGVFSVLISVVYTICALRVDDCSSSLPHLFHILPPLHEYWLELGTYCSLSWYVYKGSEWSPLYGSFFAPSFCGNSLSVWSVQKESLPCLSSNNGVSCVSFLPTPWTLENGILFYLYLLLRSHCHIGIVAMHQSLCISLSLCRIMKPRIAKLFCFHTPLLACVRWQLGLHVSWLAPCFHNNNVIE